MAATKKGTEEAVTPLRRPQPEIRKVPKPKPPPALETFLVRNVVLHEMPTVKVVDQDAAKFEETLAGAPIHLDKNLIEFFRERITGSLKRQSFDAVYAEPEDVDSEIPAKASTVPQHVVDYFASNGDKLVSVSRGMAMELYGRSGGNTSPGHLAVVDAVIGSGKNIGMCVAVLKLEDDSALLVNRITNANGETTFDAKVRQVTLPKKGKVFKAALFLRADSLAEVKPRVSDNQRDADVYGKEVSEFFTGFLGCKLRVTADRVTMQYVERALEWVNNLADEEKQAKYTNIVLADINSASTVIRPSEVAQKMSAEDRDSFLREFRLTDGSLPELTKDRTLIGSKTKNVLLEFGGNIKVWGPQEAIEEHLRKVDGQWVIDQTLKKSGPTGRR